ncbi:MAG: hypothetical protein ACI8TQ_002472 [Planctomycetota bacterium]|jgi:hypothetical protein
MKSLLITSAITLFSLVGCTAPAATGGSNSSDPNSSVNSNPAKDQASARMDAGLSGPAPSWVNTPDSHPQYPRTKYMLGVGSSQMQGNKAKTAELAINNGRKQISEELNSELKGVTQTMMREVGINGEYTSESEYIEEIRNKTSSLLIGSVEAGRHFDAANNVLYILVALDRNTQATALIDKVDAALAKTNSSADQSSATGKLQALLEEHVALDKVTPTLLTLEVVVPNDPSLRSKIKARKELVFGRLKAIYNEFRDANLSLHIVSGNAQKGFADEQLAEPIVFEASFKGQPLVGFPVTFELEHPNRGEITNASYQTGPDGRLSCKIVGLKLTGDEENALSASLDFASFGERIFKAPQASSTFSLPTFRTVTFSLLISETNLDEVLPESAVAGRLKAALGKREARVIAMNTFMTSSKMKEAVTMNPFELKQALGGKVDYLIRGTARSRFSSKLGTMNFCYAGGSLQLIDIRTGQQIATLEAPLSSAGYKKGGASQSDAGIRALAAFATDVESKFVSKIDAIFKTN